LGYECAGLRWAEVVGTRVVVGGFEVDIEVIDGDGDNDG
jgi:hypothetical protein